METQTNQLPLSFSAANMAELMESEVGKFQPRRKICGRCDYYGSYNHAGLRCHECGGEFVSVEKWTVFNFFQRVKPHLKKTGHSEANWVPVFAAHYMENKGLGDFSLTLKFAYENFSLLTALYQDYLKGHR